MMMKTKTQFSLQRWFKANKYYLLAFILPVVSMLIVFAFKDIAPFGNMTYLRSDCYHQYTPYLQILQDKLRSGGSLFYTWEIGGGMNFIAIMAYYLASPANLLTLIWPGSMADITDFFIVVKMGLAGFSMTYFLTKRFGKEGALPVAFGMTYALSAYYAAFSWNIMWLDSLWVLPFIILGLERLVREKKCLMYCIALAYGIFSNYYIGIMLCLFSVCYFIYLFITVEIPGKEDTVKSKALARLGCLGRYAVFSIISGGLSMIVILPEYFNLMLTKSAETTFPETITKYFSILYTYFRSFIAVPVADLSHYHDPNVYCSILILILIPLFWMNRKISIKERIGKTVLMLFMLFSFSINVLDYIWHGFHFPNSLPCRESFLFIFVVIIMGYELMLHLKDISYQKIIATAVAVLISIAFFYQIVDNAKLTLKMFAEHPEQVSIQVDQGHKNMDDVLNIVDQLANTTATDFNFNQDMFRVAMVSAVLVIIYTLYMCLYKLQPKLKGFFAYILVLTLFCELTLNMQLTSIPTVSDRTGYYADKAPIAKLNKVAEEQSKKEGVLFYRTEMKNADTRNNGARFNYNSISTFSSVASSAMQDFYNAMGLSQSFNGYGYKGNTPFTAALMSVKYELSKENEPSLPEYLSKIAPKLTAQPNTTDGGMSNSPTGINNGANNTDGGAYNNEMALYEYNKTLPLGFIMDPSASTEMKLNTQNAFASQNSFATAASGVTDHIFHQLKADRTSNDYAGTSGVFTAEYDLEKDDTLQKSTPDTLDVYVHAPSIEGTLSVEVDGKTQTSKTFDDMKDKYICHIGKVEKGSKITVSNNGQSVVGSQAYAFDPDTWQKVFDKLNSQALKVTEWTDTSITGTVDVTLPGTLFTSIPYEEGWTAYMDGENITPSKICNKTFIGLEVPTGQHKIEFRYTPKGFIPGILISVGSLFILILIIKFKSILLFFDNRKRKKTIVDNRN